MSVYSSAFIVAILEIKTSSLIKISHSCVVVFTGRQPDFLLRLAMKNFYSASFVPISSRATIIYFYSAFFIKIAFSIGSL